MTDIRTLDKELLDRMREAKRLSEGLADVINAHGGTRIEVLANALGHLLAMYIASPGDKFTPGADLKGVALEDVRIAMVAIVDKVAEKSLPMWVAALADDEPDEKTAVH